MKTEGSDAMFPIGNVAKGLTKRELFAAMAMQGIASHGTAPGITDADVAEVACGLADALIAELNKETPPCK